MTAPGYLPQGYKNSTRIKRVRNEDGSVKETTHWDGRQDAEVRPVPFVIRPFVSHPRTEGTTMHKYTKMEEAKSLMREAEAELAVTEAKRKYREDPSPANKAARLQAAKRLAEIHNERRR